MYIWAKSLAVLFMHNLTICTPRIKTNDRYPIRIDAHLFTREQSPAATFVPRSVTRRWRCKLFNVYQCVRVFNSRCNYHHTAKEITQTALLRDDDFDISSPEPNIGMSSLKPKSFTGDLLLDTFEAYTLRMFFDSYEWLKGRQFSS